MKQKSNLWVSKRHQTTLEWGYQLGLVNTASKLEYINDSAYGAALNFKILLLKVEFNFILFFFFRIRNKKMKFEIRRGIIY